MTNGGQSEEPKRPATPANLFMEADGMALIERGNGPVTTYKPNPIIDARLDKWLSKWDRNACDYWTFAGDKHDRLLPPDGVTVWEAVMAVKSYAMRKGYHAGKPQTSTMEKSRMEYLQVTARDKDGKAITTPGQKHNATHFTLHAGIARK